jgi:asparagine synthase (glutamine-hydrolysing)
VCGIAGFLDASATSADDGKARVEAMNRAIAHGRPDDSGTFVDAAAGIALGHRRLSIIDLSPLGQLTSADGRYVITYNGEVYNFAGLRAELAALGHKFRGGSDTEVMLAAFVAWGVERAAARLVGMFALGLWDRETRTLHFIRDRIGVKPLYWWCHNGVVLFGSDLKALIAHSAWRAEIDTEAAAFIRYSYVPTPATIFRNVHKLAPGTILSVRAGEAPRIAPFWRLRQAIDSGAHHPLDNEVEAADELDRILHLSVRGRMIADVPLGVFLSGGFDSLTVVALMQAQSNRKVRTFSIGFREPGYNEAGHAKAVASHLGADHTEPYVTARQALDVVPHLPEWFDEPFADSSQIPTYLVSAMTRKPVTVALSGAAPCRRTGSADSRRTAHRQRAAGHGAAWCAWYGARQASGAALRSPVCAGAGAAAAAQWRAQGSPAVLAARRTHLRYPLHRTPSDLGARAQAGTGVDRRLPTESRARSRPHCAGCRVATTRSPTCPTSFPRSTAAPWRSRSRRGSRCSTVG